MLSLNAWLINVSSNGCAMIVLGFLSLKYFSLDYKNTRPIIFVLLTITGTIGLFFGNTHAASPAYIGAVLSGVGTAGILLIWAESYRSISPFMAKKYTIPAAMGVGVLYYLIISMLPRTLALIAMVLLPIVSICLLRLSNRITTDNQESCNEANELKSFNGPIKNILPLRFTAFIAVYCLAPGFMKGHTTVLPFSTATGIGEAMFAGVAIVMGVIAIASIAFFKESKIDLAYKMVVPLMAAGLLLLPFLSPGQETAAAAAIMSGYILFEVYVWASLADAAANVNAPYALIFGLGKSGMNVGLLVGTFIGLNFGSSSTMLLVGVSMILVYLFLVLENVTSPGISVALPILKTGELNDESKESQDKITIIEAAQMDLAEAFSAIVAKRCEVISLTYGLSSRELEVLTLLAKGRSLQSVADSLGIAYSTVKTHTDRIYSKTGVHSRQELMLLIEGIED